MSSDSRSAHMEGKIQAEQQAASSATTSDEEVIVDFKNPYRMHEVNVLSVGAILFAAARTAVLCAN